MREFCNPLNIPSRYQHYNGQVSREAADPTLILFRDRYFIFASMSGGFYWSDDLVNWEFHENRSLDIYRYAPDVHVIGDWLVFTSSSREENSIFRRTKDPFAPAYEEVSEPFPFWDPATFQDDDGRVYLYWGCSNDKPIYGVELDPEKLTPVGEKKELIFAHPEKHGFERLRYPGSPLVLQEEQEQEEAPKKKEKLLGRMFRRLRGKASEDAEKPSDAPYFEGAFMNKWNGVYYLQYAAPGTEYATYADGVYVAEHPLGPFHYQRSNPFSSKPGGFISGAGHGSTITDRFGNLWHAATMRISVNAIFERRIGLFPAGIDRDGTLFCNQAFVDYPMEIPEGRFDPLSIKPSGMLLSYKKPCHASSSRKGYEAHYALDEDVRTAWCAGKPGQEWLQTDLQEVCTVTGIQVNFADVRVPVKRISESLRDGRRKTGRYIDTDPAIHTRYRLMGSEDGDNWTVLADKSSAETDLAHDYIPVDSLKLRYVILIADDQPYHKPFAVSGLRVFGSLEGAKPEPPARVSAKLLDEMSAEISWKHDPDSDGHVVYYGISRDKLYLSHMVYGEDSVTLTMLNRGQSYFVRVDSFNGCGITEGNVFKLK